MARTLTTVTTCDLCDCSSEYLPITSFMRRGSDTEPVDLCRWCAHPAVEPGSQLSSGGHTVTFTVDGWLCDCGARFRDSGSMTLDVWPFLVLPRVRASLASLPAATAGLHVSGRR